MSGSDDKFALMEEARVKYERLGKLLRRSTQEKVVLPSELEGAMRKFGESGNISNSLGFMNALSGCYRQIELPENMKPELQRIVNWNEYFEFDASEEEKAQLSADRIHLSCARFGNPISG
jgi:hypothetical protein